MRRCRAWVVVALLSVVVMGCRSRQLAQDQDHLRAAVLDLQTNQIIDNLIRLDQGLPIIHVDYTSLNGQIQHTASARGANQDTLRHNHAGLGLPLAVRELTWLWSAELNANQQTQLSLSGQPVLTNPQVYNAYLEYYAKPGRLMKTETPPPPGTALLVRCSESVCEGEACEPHGFRRWFGCGHCSGRKVYYWIPCEHRDDFRRLCLYAVAIRGDIQSAPEYFEVTMRGFEGNIIHDKQEKTVTATIIFDRSVPNYKGYMTARIRGRIYEKNELVLQHYPKLAKADPDKFGEVVKTDRLVLTFAIAETDEDRKDPRRVDATPLEALKDLETQVVRLRISSFAPGVSRTSDLLEAIRRELEQIKYNQQFQK